MAREDDDLLPKLKASPASRGPATKASPQMRRLMRITRAVGVLFGGFVTLVGTMALVGLVTESFWARLIVALVVVVGLPAIASDRVLKRTRLGGSLGLVGDVFAIVLLGVALVLVTVDFASTPLLVKEGDRYARSGSRTMARIVYFLAGVSPVFPEEKGAAPSSPAASSSALPDASDEGK